MKAVSLFSGCGGDTLGMKNADIDVIAFSEFNKIAIQSHLKNFPNSELIQHNNETDITKIPDEIFEKYKGVDIVFAGFPCQGFSNAGKKKINDPRNELVNEFVRVVKIVQPKYIIGENVKGLLSRNGICPETKKEKKVVDIILNLFSKIGYHVSYEVVDCQFAVPQKRERLFFIGSKEKIKINIQLPIVKHPLEPILETTLENATVFTSDNHDYFVQTEEELSGKPHPNLTKLVNENKISFGKRISPHHGEIVNPLLPTKTIICSYSNCPRLFVGLVKNDQTYIRCFTVKELLQIQGFPADFKLCGKLNDQIKQVGNAVPPPVVTHIISLLKKL